MSTNYYLARKPTPCPTCGQNNGDTEVHIGLSAGGWAFLWRGYRADDSPSGDNLTRPSEWQVWLAVQTAQGSEIRDQYGQVWTFEEFVAFVIRKRLANKGRSALHHEGDDGRPVVHAEGDDVGFYEFS